MSKRVRAYRKIFLSMLALLIFSDRVFSGETPEYQHYQETQNNMPVDAYFARVSEGVFKAEFIAYPPGMARLKSAQLISPEGAVYGPKRMFEISEEAAKNLGRLRPVFVPKKEVSRSSGSKMGGLLLGSSLVALSGLAGSSKKSSYGTGDYHHAAKKSSSGLSTLGVLGGAAPVLVAGGSGSGGASSSEGEWVYPKTAGTGVFSNVAEFDAPFQSESADPWELKALMQYPDGREAEYSFIFHPSGFPGGKPPGGPPGEKTLWDDIKLTGPRSKLL